MDSKQIEELVEKYWKCETTLEEEQALKDFFNGGRVPEGLRETAELFRYFEGEKQRTLRQDFGSTVTKKIRERQSGGKVINMVRLVRIARIAAGLLVVVVATYFIRQEVKKSYPTEMVDSISDPELALQETKKALMMISRGFGKAKEGAGKINLFNEAEKKIQGKDKETEKNKINI